MTERYNTYLPATVDKTFGSDSNAMPVQPNARDYSNVQRASVSARDPNTVSVAGITTTREAAIAAGILDAGEPVFRNTPAAPQFSKAAHELEVQHQQQVAEQQRHANAEQALFDAHNQALDVMEEQLGTVEHRNAFVQAVVEGEEEAMDLVPQAIVDGYTHVAQGWAEENGLSDMSCMEWILPEDQRQEALRAVITGNKEAFALAVHRTLNLARSVVHESWFKEEIEAAGGYLDGSNLIVEGHRYDVGDAILRGIIRWD